MAAGSPQILCAERSPRRSQMAGCQVYHKFLLSMQLKWKHAV